MPMRRSSFETAAVWALLATIVLAAIIVIPVSTIPFLYTKVFVLGAGATITLALYILARLTRGNVVLPPTLLVLALWLVPLAYALSAFFSGTGLTTATFGQGLEPDTFGFMLICGVLATLSALALRRGEHMSTFFKAVAYGGGLIFVIELVLLLISQVSPSTVTPGSSIVGPLSDLTILAGLAVVLVLITLRLIELPQYPRIGLMALGVIGLLFLAIGSNFVVWLIVALFALGLFVEAVMRRAKQGMSDTDLDGIPVVSERDDSEGGSDERPLAAPLVTLAIALFFLFGSNLGAALDNALHITVLDVSPSWQSTLNVGGHVYHSSPVFGSGPSTFGAQWLKYRDAALNQTVFWNVDFNSGIGFVPTSFVTTGVIGALAWLIFLGLFLWMGGRALIFNAPRDPLARYGATASFVGFAYLFALAIFALPGAVPLALGFIFAGVFASSMRFSKGQWGVIFSKSPRIGFVIVFGLTLLLLGSVYGAFIQVERYLAQVDLTTANSQANAGQYATAAASAARSISFAPSTAAYRLEAQIAMAQMNQIVANTTAPSATVQQQFQSVLTSGISAAISSTKLGPGDYQNWLTLGSLYAAVVPLGVTGAYDNAKAAYTTAAGLNPTSPTIPYIQAQLEVANKNNAAAETNLATAINLKGDYTQAIFLLSQLKVADGDIKQALQAALAAVYFTPNDPTILFQAGVLSAANGDDAGAVAALSRAVSITPTFSNARYFLAALYAKAKDYPDAITQLKAIAAVSDANSQAVAPLIASLQANKNPFPANLLSAPPTVK